jgi:hypothetical protein
LFEALEFLETGIHGKLELWRAFAVVAPANQRLRGVDFEHLANREEKQREEVESRRLHLAHFVFGTDRDKGNTLVGLETFPQGHAGEESEAMPLWRSGWRSQSWASLRSAQIWCVT